MRVGDNCSGCGSCLPFCPQAAISLTDEGLAFVNRGLCVECGVCNDTEHICPLASFEEDQDEIALVKQYFGRLVSNIPGEKGVGRGGGLDVKNNDVTGTLPDDKVVIRLEFNRPGGGIKFKYVEELRDHLKILGWDIGISRRHQKLLDRGIDSLALEQRILSAYLEFIIEPERLPDLINEGLKFIKGKDIWISINAACTIKVAEQLQVVLEKTQLETETVAKFNLGLGRKC